MPNVASSASSVTPPECSAICALYKDGDSNDHSSGRATLVCASTVCVLQAGTVTGCERTVATLVPFGLKICHETETCRGASESLRTSEPSAICAAPARTSGRTYVPQSTRCTG